MDKSVTHLISDFKTINMLPSRGSHGELLASHQHYSAEIFPTHQTRSAQNFIEKTVLDQDSRKEQMKKRAKHVSNKNH